MHKYSWIKRWSAISTLVDINLWIALVNSRHTHHAIVDQWFNAHTAERELLFCRPTQTGFLRLLTTKSVMQPVGDSAMTNQDAWRIYEELLKDRRVAFASEPSGIEVVWQTFGSVRTESPKLWMDAYLAAFAVAGGFRFATYDTGFKQFKGLDLELLA